MQCNVRVLTCMSDHQVFTRKRKVSVNNTPSPGGTAALFNSFDSVDSQELDLLLASPAETPPVKKRKYRLRPRSGAVTSTSNTTGKHKYRLRARSAGVATSKPVSSATVTSSNTVQPAAHWIEGRGKSGLKGIGYEPTTIKSKPWRAKFKTKQMRFATKAEAAEWFYTMNEEHK